VGDALVVADESDRETAVAGGEGVLGANYLLRERASTGW
jgi:hypothetical protein